MGVLVGCYSPTFPENQPCSETQNCPDGLACDVAANECVRELPPTATLVTISAYDDNVCGITPLGELYCWGHNARAELGLGDMDRRDTPTRVGLEADWLDVQVGRFVTCGLRAGDQLWCWGDNLAPAGGGQLNPRQIAGSYRSLTVGHDIWCAIETAGAVVCQGRNALPSAQPLPADIRAVQVSATHGTACVIDDAQRLWCWGDNGTKPGRQRRSADAGGGDATSDHRRVADRRPRRQRDVRDHHRRRVVVLGRMR